MLLIFMQATVIKIRNEENCFRVQKLIKTFQCTTNNFVICICVKCFKTVIVCISDRFNNQNGNDVCNGYINRNRYFCINVGIGRINCSKYSVIICATFHDFVDKFVNLCQSILTKFN